MPDTRVETTAGRHDAASAWLWTAVLVGAALLIRVHWNLSVHPIWLYDYSDMAGYRGRADLAVDKPFATGRYQAFYPFFTHWLLAIPKWMFGKDAGWAVGVWWAVIGSSTVFFSHRLALRVLSRPWQAHLVGAVLVAYYPLISQSGYTLSEAPTAALLTASCWLLARVLDEGSSRDAFLLGLVLGLGAWTRPQLLLGPVLFFPVWLLARDAFPRLTWTMLATIAGPLLLCLAFSAWRYTTLTGHFGLISENGPLNLVFGRCHVKGVTTLPYGEAKRGARFAPPPLIQLETWSGKYPDSWMQLDPVFGDDASPIPGIPAFGIDKGVCKNCKVEGAELQYAGYIGDGKIQRRIVSECIQRGGWGRQIRYSLTHLVQLWDYNDVWPDSASPYPRAKDPEWRWRKISQRWKILHNLFVLVPSLLGLVFYVRARRRPHLAALAAVVLSMMVTGALVFGDIRLRTPYDPLLLILACEVWVLAVSWLGGRWQKPKTPRETVN
jgi:hypothetical protein